jgi:hypothetical protein
MRQVKSTELSLLSLESTFTQTSVCEELLGSIQKPPQQHIFAPGSLTLAVTQSDSHKPLEVVRGMLLNASSG